MPAITRQVPRRRTELSRVAAKSAAQRPGVVSNDARSVACVLLDAPRTVRRGILHQLPPREMAHVIREVQRETGTPYGLYGDDPIGFIEDVIGETLWGRQAEIMRLLVIPQVKRVAVPAGFGVGKCASADETIPLADGRMVAAKDLVGTTFEVIAWDQDGHQVRRAARAEWNRVEPVYRVRTTSGREITRNLEHPLWMAEAVSTIKGGRARGTVTLTPTVRGWVGAGKLVPGDLVLVPEEHHAEGTVRVDDNDAILLGYLLGDGGTSQSQPTFTQQEGPALEEMRRTVEQMGAMLVYAGSEDRPYNYRISGQYRPDGEAGTRRLRNGVIDRVRAWGMGGKTARTKSLPAWAWTLPNDQLALVIGRLMACDGNVYAKEAPGNRLMARVSITLASEQLIRDVEMAMLRLGVWGNVRHRRIRYNGGFNDAWEWSCRDPDALLRLAQVLNMPGKNEAMARCVELVKSRPLARRRSWPRRNAPAGYRWDPVESVECLPDEMTVAIEVDVDHTFVTTFVEHNTTVLGRAVAWAGAVNPVGTMQVVTTATRMRQVRSQMWPHIKTAVAKAGLPGHTDTVQWLREDQYGNKVQVAYGFSAAPNDEAAMQGIHGCFDELTEVLTSEGWKHFPDVHGGEQVMSLRPDGVAEWGPITEVTDVEIDGYLNIHDGDRLNFAVTDGHRMLWSPMHYRKPEWLTCPYCEAEVGAKGRARHEGKHLRAGAEKLDVEWAAVAPAERHWHLGSYMNLPQEFFVRRTNTWEGTPFEPVTFPGSRPGAPDRTFTADQFARFLGWYVAEGHVQRTVEKGCPRNAIYIAQIPGAKFEIIGALLDEVGIRYSRTDHHLTFRHKALAAWLEEHCGIGSGNKRVPAIIKEAPQSVIRAFLDAYRQGDGTRHTRPDSARYITSSRALADDVHELLVKMGSARKLRLMQEEGSEGRIGDKTFLRRRDVWVVTEAGRPSDSNIKKANVQRVRHQGRVYCVTTPNETIMVRRKGCPMWCGNTPKLLLVVDEAGGIAPLIGKGTNNLLTGDAKLLATGNPAMDDPGSWFEKLCEEGESGTEPSTATLRIGAIHSPAITGEPTPICRLCPPSTPAHTIAQGVNGKSHLPDWDWLMRTLRDYGATLERELTLPEVLELGKQDGLHPYLIAKVFAQFPKGSSNRIIPATWVELAQNVDEPTGPEYVAVRDLGLDGENDPWLVQKGAWVRLGIDVAADGGDEFAISRIVGDLTTVRHTSSGSENADSMRVSEKALEHILAAERLARAIGSTRPVRVKIDTIGVGWGIVGHLRRLRDVGRHGAEIVPVHVGESIHPTRVNEAAEMRPWRKRDEMWLAGRQLLQPDPTTGEGRLRLRVSKKAAAQLATPNIGFNSGGFVVVESKKVMRARGVSSPDVAEAVLLGAYEPEPIEEVKRFGLL